MKKLVLFFATLFVVSAFSAAGATLQVPGTYPTIQAAINASQPGDVIQVAAGNFVESLSVAVPNLTIQGAGAALTIIKTIGATPAVTLYSNGFTMKNLQITNNSQMKEGIRVLSPASSGLTLDGVYFTKIGNGTSNAYAINIPVSFSALAVKNCQFTATLASTRAMAVYSGKNITQTNWLFENNLFQYLYTGIYMNSSVNGISLQSNNFGPWDINDCKQAAAGLYIGDGGSTFTIQNVSVTGNTFNSYARGVYFLNNVAGGVIGATEITDNIFTNSIWSSGVRLVAGTDGYGVYLPSVLEGPVTVCENFFSQGAPIVNGSGVAMIDFRSVTGGESAATSINVCNNDITFTGAFTLSTWGIMLRGPFTSATISGNTLSGNNVGGSSPDMPPTSGICVQTNYYNYGAMNSGAQYNFLNNTITGFVNGISVYDMLNKTYGAVPGGAKIVAKNNAIYGNTTAISSGAGERTNARNNWWGDNTGPLHSTNPTGAGNPVTDYVDFLPWWCDVGMTTVCPPPAPGSAILNTNTGIWYPSTGLATALAAAVNGHTLYVAPGTVTGGVHFNYPGKTIDVIGSGIPGASVISGVGRAMTIYNGNINFGNGLQIEPGVTPAKTIVIEGGNVKMRDCIIVEDPANFQSAIALYGGSLDMGTNEEPGENLFVINDGGAALYQVPFTTTYALGNDWGSTKGPEIASNPGGNGGRIFGAGKDYVLYDPWRAGPVTVASKVKVCNGETTVNIPVKVASFNGVGSLALKMQYDVTRLINPVMSYQDAAFSAWGFLTANTTTPGEIIVTGNGAWPAEGISLGDSTIIFTLSFNLVPGTTYATLDFVDDMSGASCRYTGSAPFFLRFGDAPQATHYINGSMTYDTNPPVPVSITIAAVENPVEPGTQVTLNATPVNGGAAPAYLWKVNGVDMGTSHTLTYTPNYGDEVKCILTSSEQCVTGSPASSNTIVVYVVEFNVTVSDTVHNGETICFDAGKVLTIGGLPNTFLLEAGGSADLVAGQKILLLEGVTIEAGAYLHAWIAPSGPFCTPPITAPQVAGNQEPLFSADETVRFKAYPNPTDGEFTLVQRDNDLFDNVQMTVYSMQGKTVMTRQLSGQASYKFSMAGYPEGFYFIRLVSADNVETIKLIRTR